MTEPVSGLAAAVAAGLVIITEPVPIAWIKADAEIAHTICAPDQARVPDWVSLRGCHIKFRGVYYVIAPDPPMKRDGDGRLSYTSCQWSTLGHETKHVFDGPFHESAQRTHPLPSSSGQTN